MKIVGKISENEGESGKASKKQWGKQCRARIFSDLARLRHGCQLRRSIFIVH